jgi:hypothetical protein
MWHSHNQFPQRIAHPSLRAQQRRRSTLIVHADHSAAPGTLAISNGAVKQHKQGVAAGAEMQKQWFADRSI